MYKSTEKVINQNFESAKFCEINGRILRNLNILDDKKPKLNALITLFSDVDFTEFSECINYLSLRGYIKLINICTHKETAFEIKEFDNIAVRLAAKGIRLLKGRKQDKSVDI